jgi:hypothetical protein
MKAIPDLSRTKICKTLINTGVCDDPDCKYAHNKEELRHVAGVPTQLPTPQVYQQLPAAPRDANTTASGGAQKAPANAALAGAPFNPAALGLPPMLVGQNVDPATQAILIQQWMSNMATHMAQMQMQMMVAAQTQDQTRGGTGMPMGYPGLLGPDAQPQDAPGSQSFLYNALFSGAGGVPQGPLPGGSVQGASAPKSRGDKIGKVPNPRSAIQKAANKTMPTTFQEQREGPPQQKTSKEDVHWTCCGSQHESDAKFCRSCGRPQPMTPIDVPYKVKNTFVDVVSDDGSSPPKGGLRSVQSAAARLYAFAGDSTPQKTGKDSPGNLSSASLNSMGASPGFGDESSRLILPSMNRGNTWGSNLDALAEDVDEDFDVQQQPDGDSSTGHEGLESHLNHNGDGAASGSDDEGRRARGASGSFDSSAASFDGSREGQIGLESMVIKNTFLEYKAAKPMGGMRMVQTAAGRLDLMSEE